jgi:protein-L-isoaspartate(D-aspartate) O-methyltransferase
MVFDETRLEIVRRAYAKQMLALAGVSDNLALEDAFASVRRERFIGPPPWRIVGPRGLRVLLSDDPVPIYQDVLIALSPDRGVNNGSPMLHAIWLNALGPLEGARVAHIGAGTGYYSAILSRLVGERGQILAVECDRELVERAERNLSEFENVAVIEGDGATLALGPVDAIYVNFAVGRPAENWIDALALGGRLIFPLGVPGRRRGASGGRHADGAGFRIERGASGFAAAWLGGAFFVSAVGALAPSVEDCEPLHAAFEKGGVEFVRSLRWKEPPSPDRSWFIGSGWSLSYEEPGS